MGILGVIFGSSAAKTFGLVIFFVIALVLQHLAYETAIVWAVTAEKERQIKECKTRIAFRTDVITARQEVINEEALSRADQEVQRSKDRLEALRADAHATIESLKKLQPPSCDFDRDTVQRLQSVR